MQPAATIWRRHFLSRSTLGLGTAALAALLDREAPGSALASAGRGLLPHFPARARRVIYLFMSGGPSQIDLFDPKPNLLQRFNEELPESVRSGQRLTTMTSGQRRFAIAPSKFRFARHGQSGAWLSELLPHLGTVADELAIVKTVHTDAINHDPAVTFLQTGSQIPGRPSLGSWISYGLGSANDQFPTFAVLQSRWSARVEAQALSTRLWGTGFLPTRHAGVALRGEGDPVLYLSDPPGVSRTMRRDMLDGLARLNRLHLADSGDSAVAERIAQYELAYRMQDSIPQLADFTDEPSHVLQMYGPDVRRPGSFAANCLLARRLAQRDVRFIQVFIRGWDHHADLPRDLALQCRDVDQATAALIRDLRQHGLLDQTLVVWGGEFGRTTYCQGKLTTRDYGRDHHPRCFTMLLAGGGIRPGISYGRTDEFGYNVADRPVHVHDLNATILHCLGLDHRRLVFRFQGRDFRLTDVHGRVVRGLLS